MYDFSIIKKIHSICIVGENACRKSSLFHALRGIKNDMSTESLYENDFRKLADFVDIEHSYNKIFYYDNVKNNGNNFMVSYDASEYISSGGYQTKDKSHGETSLILFFEKLKKELTLTKSFIPHENLIIFDEVDNGFSIKNMNSFINLITNLIFEYKVDVIVISHNPFLMKNMYLLYDFENKEFVSAGEYIKKQTGFVLTKEE